MCNTNGRWLVRYLISCLSAPPNGPLHAGWGGGRGKEEQLLSWEGGLWRYLVRCFRSSSCVAHWGTTRCWRRRTPLLVRGGSRVGRTVRSLCVQCPRAASGKWRSMWRPFREPQYPPHLTMLISVFPASSIVIFFTNDSPRGLVFRSRRFSIPRRAASV